jgi:hypothetical protein
MCPKHAVYLEDSENVQNRLNRWSYISAERVVRPVLPKPVDLRDTCQLSLVKIAIDTDWLLNQRNLAPGLQSLENCYLTILMEKGLAHDQRWVQVKELMKLIREKFPSPLLQMLHCDFDEQKPSSWPSNLISYANQE